MNLLSISVDFTCKPDLRALLRGLPAASCGFDSCQRNRGVESHHRYKLYLLRPTPHRKKEINVRGFFSRSIYASLTVRREAEQLTG